MSPRRVLLDECMPRKLIRHITGHEVQTVQGAGWRSFKNGDLLRLAEVDFDVFVTLDRNVAHQQNLARFDIAVIVILAGRNRDILPFVPDLLDAIPKAKPDATPLFLRDPALLAS